jgi:hypothetical protein
MFFSKEYIEVMSDTAPSLSLGEFLLLSTIVTTLIADIQTALSSLISSCFPEMTVGLIEKFAICGTSCVNML